MRRRTPYAPLPALAVLAATVGCDSNPTAPTAPKPPEVRKSATPGAEPKAGEKNLPPTQNSRSFD